MNLSLPNLNFILKVAFSMVVVGLLVSLIPGGAAGLKQRVGLV